MENYNLALTLATGVVISFALFFLFYKGLRKSGKLASLLTILIVQVVFIPLSVFNWAGLDVFAIHFAFFTMTAYGLGIITSTRDARLSRDDNAKQGWFHWAPALIVGFFLILVMVDSTIITLAGKGASSDFISQFLPEPRRESASNVTSAFPGTVSHDFHKKYDLYNNYVDQLKTQRERGWKISDGWVAKPQYGKPELFRIYVQDKNAQAVSGAKVEVSFLRPSNKGLDQSFALPEAEAGYYGLALELPAPGLWTVVISVTRGDEVHEVKGETWIEEA